MEKFLISVIIDTYNYGQFIEEAVDSVLAQDFPRAQIEILVVDDGSTDDTQEKLRKYGDAIRYLRKPNGGQASAFNFGFQHARGEIIALLDADDVWLPAKLQRIHKTFESNPQTGMVYHRTYVWTGGSQLTPDGDFIPVCGRVPEDRAQLLRYPMMPTSSLAFRREALEQLLPVPEALRSQADAYLTALIIFVAPIMALPECLTKYRQHDANLFQMRTAGTSNDRIEHRMAMRAALLEAVRSWLKLRGYDLEAKNLRAYLKQWTKAQEADSFCLQPPGRWKYFCHLLEFPLIYADIMTARHRIYSYLRALSALLLGYHHLHFVDDTRIKYKRVSLFS